MINLAAKCSYINRPSNEIIPVLYVYMRSVIEWLKTCISISSMTSTDSHVIYHYPSHKCQDPSDMMDDNIILNNTFLI